MALTRWDPYSEMMSLRQAMDRLLAESFVDFGRAGMPGGIGAADLSGAVPVDLVERDDALVATVSLPGVKPEDVDVSVHQNVLTIQGEMRGETDQGKGRYHLRERWQGSFTRQMTLPVEVSPDACDATFEDGVLTIRLPKSERAQAKRISVRGGERPAIEGEQRETRSGNGSEQAE
jgi:HSP20 family protein